MSQDLRILAKLAAGRAISSRRRSDPIEHLAWMESGEPFAQAGVADFMEGLEDLPPDAPTASPERVEALRGVVEREGGADLGAIYMKQATRAQRHARGEYYTPEWLVEHVLDRAGFDGAADATLLDPMCGAGAFLIGAVTRLRRRRPEIPAARIVQFVHGMDVNPLAVLMARAAYLQALFAGGAARLDAPISIPVARADAIAGHAERAAYDIVAGNPPWVGWESLPASFREQTRDLWKRHGLFADRGGADGMQVLLGRSKKDLAMLATYQAADRYLRRGGRLSFVMTRTVLKSVGSGTGFRRFTLSDGTPLRVLHVDELAAGTFPRAGGRAAVLTLVKGEVTVYPVAYQLLGSGGSAIETGLAEPVDRADPTSAWLTGPADKVQELRPMLGPSSYRARAGAYTGGANGVYWVRVMGESRRGGVEVANLADSGKRRVPSVTARVEADLLYPLLRASDIARLSARPSAWILLPQDPVRRRGIDHELMASHYPLALAYLRCFGAELAERKDRGTGALIRSGAPFYSIFSVSEETLAAWKVVWPRIASRVTAAAVGPCEGRPVVPQETCTFIACRGKDAEAEAYFLAALLNATLFNEAAAAFGQTGGKGFAAPHLLRHIAVPRFDGSLPGHARLSALGRRGPDCAQNEIDTAAARIWSTRTGAPAGYLASHSRTAASTVSDLGYQNGLLR